MIRHIRKQEWENIHEAKHGEKRAREEQQRGQRPAVAARMPEQRDDRGDEPERKEPLPPLRGVDRPMRIDENEIGRPEEFSDVEPNYATSEQAALHETEIELN